MPKRIAALCLAVALFAPLAAAPAAAVPPSTDPPTAARIAATWLARQVNDQGFIAQAADATKPNLSTSAQAVLALTAAGVGRTQVDALLAYLGSHLDDFVASNGNDDPGALAYLILGSVAAGKEPTAFGPGGTDLVARLEATRQSNGLFGAADPTFDGAFRQGLALLALEAAGRSDAAAADWLTAQQCPNGSWTAFRADTSQPCPAVDPAAFTGPDTNSTALAALGLFAQGRTAPATTGANALEAVRNADGAWGFLSSADQSTDANSTGLVVAALRAITGVQDPRGVAALLTLQVGCDAPAADIGGIAFQPSGTGLVPDALATAQATPALAGVVLPLANSTVSTQLAEPCPAAVTTTTVSVATAPPATNGSTTTTTTVSAGTASRGELPRTGAAIVGQFGVALLLCGCGGVALCVAADRRRRYS